MNVWLRDNVIDLIRQYGIDAFAALAAEATVPVGIMCSLLVVVLGIRAYFGNALISDFIKTVAIVVAVPLVALSYHNFAGSLLGLISEATEGLALTIAQATGIQGGYGSLAETLDYQYDKVNEHAAALGGANAGLLDIPDPQGVMLSVLMGLGSIGFLVIGLLYFIAAVIVHFFVAVAPAAVLLYMAPFTRPMVAGWLRNALSYSMLPIFLSFIVGAMSGFVDLSFQEFDSGNDITFKMVMQWLAIMLAFGAITLISKNFAAGIAGGLTLDGGREMHFAASRSKRYGMGFLKVGAASGAVTGRNLRGYASSGTQRISNAWRRSAASQRINTVINQRMRA